MAAFAERTLAVVITLVLLTRQCSSFSASGRIGFKPLVSTHTATTTITRPTALSSSLFGGSLRQNRWTSKTFMSQEEEEEAKEVSSDDDDKETEKFGFTRALFLAVPLFLKFCLVLFIKFLTDLVVFPILILYRAVRLTKRRVLKLFGKESDNNKKAVEDS